MMKKTISMLLAFVMLMLSLPAFAAPEDAEKMQEVLLLVKEKITVPEELTEFSGDVSEYKEKATYYFEWTSEDYSKSMSVSSDAKGRILSYYARTVEASDKRISDVSKAELISFAESFLRKTVPETFVSETDLLVYDDDDYLASGNLMYNLGFVRKKNGIPVKNNYASVGLCVVEDKIYVRSMNINYVYHGEFEESGEDLTDYAEKYKELFPVELVYRDKYQPKAKKNEPRYLPKLIYRIKDDDIGYMDISTGERLKEDSWEEIYLKEESAADSAPNMLAGGGGGSLTPQEIEELGVIEGLVPAEEIVKTVKNLPYIKFDERLEERSSSLYKGYPDKYSYNMRYVLDSDRDYKYFNISADAKTGEILSLSNNSGIYDSDVELTEAEIAAVKEKIAEFLNAVAKDKFAEVEEAETTDYYGSVDSQFVRMVMGVKYVDDGIRVSFDAENNLVDSYRLDFTDAEFENPKDAISAEDAYAKILEFSPISPIYIMSGGKYKKAVCLKDRYASIGAILGENENEDEENKFNYSDISGHWVETAATKLAEIQVGIAGDALEPDKKITQEEFLRLLTAGIYGPYYYGYDTDELYDMMIRDKMLAEEEKAPLAEISREDAFVFMIRMAGYERIAKLSDIYKVEYSDGHMLSEGKIGYAAILSGLGVVCGNGGALRPQDKTSRAEAIMMMYKYLLAK